MVRRYERIIYKRLLCSYLCFWSLDVKKHANPNTTIVLVGNKCDLKTRSRQVTREEGEKFAKDNDIPLFIETSAKSAENVEEVFAQTAEDVYEKIKSGVFSPNEVRNTYILKRYHTYYMLFFKDFRHSIGTYSKCTCWWDSRRLLLTDLLNN